MQRPARGGKIHALRAAVAAFIHRLAHRARKQAIMPRSYSTYIRDLALLALVLSAVQAIDVKRLQTCLLERGQILQWQVP